MRTASWIAASTGCARGPVTQRLRVGRVLRDHFDRIDRAVTDGTLRFDHAKALVDTANPRTIDALAAAQTQIIALAEGATFDQWKTDVSALAEVADTDGPEPDPYQNLSLKMPVTIDRTVHLDGTFDHASGLTVRQAINAKADEIFRRLTRDHEQTSDVAIPSRAALRALALVELIREATGAEPGSGSLPRAEVTLVAHDHQVCDTDGVPLPQAAADVRPRHLGRRREQHGHPRRRRPHPSARHHRPTPSNHRARRRLHLSRLRRTDQLVRHAPRSRLASRWTMRLDKSQIPHWTTPSGDHLVGQRHHRRHRAPDAEPDPSLPMPPDSGDTRPRSAATRSKNSARLEHTFLSTMTLEPPP